MYNILLLDDEPWIVKGLEKKILELGDDFKVIGSANHAAEAMTKIKSLQPDIIITDIVMPETNGLEFVKKSQRPGSFKPFYHTYGL